MESGLMYMDIQGYKERRKLIMIMYLSLVEGRGKAHISHIPALEGSKVV